MDTTIKFNPDLDNLAKSAFIIEKIHSCEDCPIRQAAIKRPRSIFARMHLWHKNWWPAWKTHQARTCAYAAAAHAKPE